MAGRLRKLLPRFSLRTLVLFLLLVTSATGLWWHWEAWAAESSFKFRRPLAVRFSEDGTKIEVVYHDPETKGCLLCRHDPSSGKRLSVPPVELAPATVTRIIENRHQDDVCADGRRAVVVDDAVEGVLGLVFDNREMAVLACFGRFPAGSGIIDYGFAKDGQRLLLVSESEDCTVYFYRRRRPEWWWGVFYLWEFWLTAAFAGLLAWSIVADRRRLREET